MRIIWLIVLLALPPLQLLAAPAGVTARDLAQNARRYLNQPIIFRGAYCYSTANGYDCRTTEPLRIEADTMPAGDAKTAMDRNCGEIDGIEQSVDCRFSLQMVPTEVATRDADYTRGGRNVRGRITVVTATVISARKE